jgi:hypothetical protein
MSRYLYILASQSPADVGVDNLNRVVFSCNYYACVAENVADWEQEIAKILKDEGILSSLNTDYFIGTNRALPGSTGPFTLILNTGGLSSKFTHNGDRYERLKCQIIVHGSDYLAVRTKAYNIWRELDGQYNRIVTL